MAERKSGSIPRADDCGRTAHSTALAPFAHPQFGTHASYLLARTHHLAEERAEATHHYEGTLGDYAKQKVEAAKMLQQPQTFKNDPVIRARFESPVCSSDST